MRSKKLTSKSDAQMRMIRCGCIDFVTLNILKLDLFHTP
jgi:hypothetical protein